MKNLNIKNVKVINTENQDKRLEFIKFLVNYFINNQMSEVNLRYEKFSKEIKRN